jgi:hypothetical protein
MMTGPEDGVSCLRLHNSATASLPIAAVVQARWHPKVMPDSCAVERNCASSVLSSKIHNKNIALHVYI